MREDFWREEVDRVRRVIRIGPDRSHPVAARQGPDGVVGCRANVVGSGVWRISGSAFRDWARFRSPTRNMVSVSTRDDKQNPEARYCTHDTEGDDLLVKPAEGLGLALLMPIASEIFALMTFANEGVSTSSLLRDLLRVDMVGDKEMAWCTSKSRQSLYVRGGSR